ncbi:DMT family transporter [Paenibacillus sp. PDC88]|uniref:DMT family transporter n=1 Tax=Paenibacillus sp. PDC88 TaxID=1884375 RepID=UPI000899C44F|nr:DMT family transporter [Paenibacillus sp. PDC88]SDW12012.1 Permease of the drug/metabolite transporter (DMT) superfamily [Paenibacillus sp. PDC88]
MKVERKADLQMLLVTLLWGSSYLFMKEGLTSIQELNMIALRFGLAFILMGIIFYRTWSKMTFRTLRQGFVLGAVLFVAFVFITYGVKQTTTSQAGFLISLSVVFVPILVSIVQKRWPEAKIVCSILLAIAGIGLLTLENSMQLKTGDLLCIMGALSYALYILLSGRMVQQGDGKALSILQLGFAGGLALLFSILFEEPKLPASEGAWISILGLAVLCSAVAYTLQIMAQKHISSTRAGLIFSLEPVFAAGFAYAIYGEQLSLNGYMGAALILGGVILTEVKWNKLLHFKKRNPSQRFGI